MVRDTLGEEAIIVATREEKGGKAVRVTAAVEPAFEVGANGNVAEPNGWLQYDEEEETGSIAEALTDMLLRHSVPEDVMEHIISCAAVMGVEEPGIALIAAIEHLFTFQPLPAGPHSKALMMVGPPGGGKTLAVAKMAARGTMNGLKVGVITADTVRAGGVEQLGGFTRLLQIDLKKAEDREDLKAILDDMEGMDQVLIDTRGLNPFDPEDIRHIARIVGLGDVEPVLVMAAGGDPEESAEMARVFSTIGTRALLPTRIDMARRIGGLLAAAHQGGMHFTDASNTPKVAEGLTPVTAKSLARLLMPAAYRTTARPQQVRRTGTTQ